MSPTMRIDRIETLIPNSYDWNGAKDQRCRIKDGSRPDQLLLRVIWKVQCFSSKDLMKAAKLIKTMENEITKPVTKIYSDAVLRCRTGH